MGKASLIDNLREWLAGIAFAIYLRLIRMSKEEFWAEQDRQAREAMRVGGAGEGVAADEPKTKHIDLLYQYVEDLKNQDHVPIDDRVASYLVGFAYWLERRQGRAPESPDVVK